MKTNDLKKGTRVRLRNGWDATLTDNRKGNTREAMVEGVVTERGSIYSHDIVSAQVLLSGVWAWAVIEHTPAQLACREMNRQLFGS